jgi:hypothetical protein
MSTTADPSLLDNKYSSVVSLRDLKRDIARSLSDISGVPITNDANGKAITDLKTAYTKLDSDIDNEISSWSKTDFTTLTLNLQRLSIQKETYDRSRRDIIKNKSMDLTFTGFTRRIANDTLENIATTSIIIGFILGGIVMSNNYIEKSVNMRLFYFVYGAALFPISLLYGIVNTPTWHSTIIPLVRQEISAIALFSYRNPNLTIDSPTGGYKTSLMICCIISLLMISISLFLLSI